MQVLTRLDVSKPFFLRFYTVFVRLYLRAMHFFQVLFISWQNVTFWTRFFLIRPHSLNYVEACTLAPFTMHVVWVAETGIGRINENPHCSTYVPAKTMSKFVFILPTYSFNPSIKGIKYIVIFYLLTNVANQASSFTV